MKNFFSINLGIRMLILALMMTSFGDVQSQHKCGFDHVMEQAKQNNPFFEKSREEIERFTQEYAKKATHHRTNTILRIPTVVHVVHNGEVEGTYPNMSEEQITSGIVALNHAFRNTGSWHNTPSYQHSNIAGHSAHYNNDMHIEFVLAKRTPDGKPTTGILRHDVTGKPYATTYNTSGIKGNSTGVPPATLFADYIWNPQDYMNIWIVKKIDGVDVGTSGQGILGYATIPSTVPGVRDGLVCQARAFGYYSGAYTSPTSHFDFGTSAIKLNGTANHEVGHYLNLQHTFQGDGDGSVCPSGTPLVVGINDDGCSDTPRHKRTNSTCPSYTANGNECDNKPNEYIHNFMNYSRDRCFHGFSNDQRTRCRAALEGHRKALLNSLGATTPDGEYPAPIAATVGTNPSYTGTQGINDITLNGVTFTSKILFYDGGYLDRTASQPTVELATGQTYNMTVQVGLGTPQNNELVHVYIDYNGNNTFEVLERVYATPARSGKTNGDIFSFSFTTPANVSYNKRLRMRVISGFDNGSQNGGITSATETDGQIEDYSVRFSTIQITQHPQATKMCNSNPAALSVVATPVGGGTLAYQWQKKSGNTWSDVSGATSSTYSPASGGLLVTGTYRCKITGSSSSTIHSNAVEVKAASTTLSELKLPTEAGTYTSSRSFIDTDGWTHYATCNDELLLSLKIGSTGAVIPDNGVSIKLSESKATLYSGGTGFITNSSGAVLMNRTWNVAPTTQPTSPIEVRSYYTQAEFESVNDLVKSNGNGGDNGSPLTGVSQMKFYKATAGAAHAAVSSIASNQVIMLNNGATPSTTVWKAGTFQANHYAEFQVASFSGGGGGGATGGTALPVELMYFQAEKDGKNALLTWATASEENNKGFEIEYSTNGRVWESIGWVDGHGHSAEVQTYQFVHEDLAAGVNYYRLKQTDFDGTHEYSEIRMVSFNHEIRFVIAPNPSLIGSKNSLMLYASKAETAEVQIYNIQGKLLLQQSLEVTAGNQRINLPTRDLAAGTYTVRLVSHQGTQSALLIRN